MLEDIYNYVPEFCVQPAFLTQRLQKIIIKKQEVSNLRGNVELVFKVLNHLAAILHVYAWV